MKDITRACLIAAMLILPVAAHAQDTAPLRQASNSEICPVAGDMDALKIDVENLSVEVNQLADQASDPETRASLRKMAEHVANVSARVRKMHDALENSGDSGVLVSVKAEKDENADKPK